ncbi:glutamyl-tRNA reductase [Ferroacidibacillus organovorans]|uniref:Glutamyl-tRNA reductase n=1 Tax=Ferroacidibacillus organovorans TaxID=1765683 RepID=A0A124IW93_9BACL|nr:glutamyl-tRNA reductase [Ferroacidibacillus organovorans]KUO96706.1 hypothetical protein ATW55_07730 [Ferroacidibacillus organovorans]
MSLVALSLNYRTAPVEVRERFAVPDDQVGVLVSELHEMQGIHEVVLLSTCNRTELYAHVEQPEPAIAKLIGYLSRLGEMEYEALSKLINRYQDRGVLDHLLRVVSGLDSMVIGETQILGQVRHAYLIAQDHLTTGQLMNHAMRLAISFGKRVQTETMIGQAAVSVSYAAVSLAKKVFSTMSGKTVLVIGAGKMSELTLTHLRANGVAKIIVVNRTLENAQALASAFAGIARPWEQLAESLAEADIVISGTGAKGYVLTEALLTTAIRNRKRRPLFIIDIAVPRDVDPCVAQMDGLYLYDIDDLQGMVAEGFALRHHEAQQVEQMIEDELATFAMWQAEQQVVPLIAELREKSLAIQASVMESLQHKLSDLDERQLDILRKHTSSIVNQLLRDPIASIKEMAKEPGGGDALRTFARIFDLSALPDETPGVDQSFMKKTNASSEPNKAHSLTQASVLAAKSEPGEPHRTRVSPTLA